MGQAEILIAGLLVAVAGLSALARLLSVPYPIVLVIGGAAFGFIPGMPEVKLDPNVVLVVFLPPLLYGAAFFANLGDIRANLRGAHAQLRRARAGHDGRRRGRRPTRSSPACPGRRRSRSAPSSRRPTRSPARLIMRRLGVPRRLVSAVEGEGLFNDATALVAYRVAVAAVVGGSFSLGRRRAALRRRRGAAGVAIGLAVGWVIA